MKDVSQLTSADFRAHPVWRFTGSDKSGETLVTPIKRLPVKSLSGSIVGCEVKLASGEKIVAMLGNIHADNARLTEHFMTLSVLRVDGEVFHLARYHDFDFNERGPAALAEFLKMKKENIFPIAWDIRHLVNGEKNALHGILEEIPRERLTRAQIIALAVP
jgi:hypothetical protein